MGGGVKGKCYVTSVDREETIMFQTALQLWINFLQAYQVLAKPSQYIAGQYAISIVKICLPEIFYKFMLIYDIMSPKHNVLIKSYGLFLSASYIVLLSKQFSNYM